MMRRRESLPIRLIKHPVIWSGVGLVVRYHDDDSTKGAFWKLAGILAIVGGASWSLAKANSDTHFLE